MGEKKLGVVVVGTGFGCRVHVPVVRAAGMEVVALVGTDRDRTARRADRNGVGASYDSLEQALRLPGADIVVVASPPATHAALAEEAMAAGRHVLVEKPFASSASEARQLLEIAERAGVVAQVGHEFRFASSRATMQTALTDGLVGSPRLVTVVGHHPLAAPMDVKVPGWWFDPRNGGGWLGAAVSHWIDALRCWLGEFESVSASLPMVTDRDPSTNAEDSVSMRFCLGSGCQGILQESAGVWGDRYQLIRVIGPRGTLTLMGESVVIADRHGTRILDPLDIPIFALGDFEDRTGFTHLELAPACVQAAVLRDRVLGVGPSLQRVQPATFADGVACMEVIDAVRQSATNHGALTTIT